MDKRYNYPAFIVIYFFIIHSLRVSSLASYILCTSGHVPIHCGSFDSSVHILSVHELSGDHVGDTNRPSRHAMGMFKSLQHTIERCSSLHMCQLAVSKIKYQFIDTTHTLYIQNINFAHPALEISYTPGKESRIIV